MVARRCGCAAWKSWSDAYEVRIERHAATFRWSGKRGWPLHSESSILPCRHEDNNATKSQVSMNRLCHLLAHWSRCIASLGPMQVVLIYLFVPFHFPGFSLQEDLTLQTGSILSQGSELLLGNSARPGLPRISNKDLLSLLASNTLCTFFLSGSFAFDLVVRPAHSAPPLRKGWRLHSS